MKHQQGQLSSLKKRLAALEGAPSNKGNILRRLQQGQGGLNPAFNNPDDLEADIQALQAAVASNDGEIADLLAAVESNDGELSSLVMGDSDLLDSLLFVIQLYAELDTLSLITAFATCDDVRVLYNFVENSTDAVLPITRPICDFVPLLFCLLGGGDFIICSDPANVTIPPLIEDATPLAMP